MYQRNPVATALGCLLTLVMAVLVALNVENLPLIGNGSTHHAEFSESSGLTKDSEVRVAGVRVGKVTDVELSGDHVDVTFTAGDTWMGDQTTAAIKLGSLLGRKYLAIDPRGEHESSGVIPLHRTASLYDVMTAFQGLSDTMGRVDTGQLAQSFRTMSDTLRGTPQQMSGALRGLSALSTSIASRDQQLKNLLHNTNQVAGLARSRNEQFQKLLTDGNALLGEIQQRRNAVHSLLIGTRNLSAQLNGLVDEDAAQLRPTLDSLDQVTALLARNQGNLDSTVRKLGPYFRLIGNTLGNGRWIDTYVCGLLPPAVGPVNSKGCVA